MATNTQVAESNTMESVAHVLSAFAGLAWALLAVAIIWSLRNHLVRAARALLKRVEDGAAVEIGFFKLARLNRVATSGEPVRDRKVGRVKTYINAELQQEILAEQKRNYFTFLVHYAFPLQNGQGAYDVILYVYGHFYDLRGVVKVEYFLGEGWGNAVFVCKDGRRNFAIKVAAVGSFLAMAKVHHWDGTIVTESRFVELRSLSQA